MYALNLFANASTLPVPSKVGGLGMLSSRSGVHGVRLGCFDSWIEEIRLGMAALAVRLLIGIPFPMYSVLLGLQTPSRLCLCGVSILAVMNRPLEFRCGIYFSFQR